MSDNVKELRLTRPAAPVAGFVEAIKDSEVLGWAWQPGQATRVTVELRLGEQVLSRSIAEAPREDLARNGIGDGAHAFSLAIPPEFRGQSKELTVVACLPDGSVAKLEAPPPPASESDGLGRVQRGLDMLIGSQRLIHRNLQAALTQHDPGLTKSFADISAAQSRLEESINTLECFVVRIEQALGAEGAPGPAARNLPYGWIAIGVSALALAGSATALWRVLFAA